MLKVLVVVLLLILMLFMVHRELDSNKKIIEKYIDYSNRQNQLINDLKERLDSNTEKLNRKKLLVDLLINDIKYKEYKIEEQTSINNKNLRTYSELDKNIKVITNTKSCRIRNKHIKQFINKFKEEYKIIK